MATNHYANQHNPIPIIDTKHCDGCGLCVKACPTQAVGLDNSKAFIIDPQACEYTGLCEMICPVQAIHRPFIVLTNLEWSKDDES
jgi:NAD-dependent dihydropyrimidine dehydrogenase PreA subunit